MFRVSVCLSPCLCVCVCVLAYVNAFEIDPGDIFVGQKMQTETHLLFCALVVCCLLLSLFNCLPARSVSSLLAICQAV